MDFNTSGTMRSPFSPRVRQSITGRRPIGLASAKKTPSKFMQSSEIPTGDVIYKTPFTTLETYGMPLPVMVTEALTFASGDVSVRLSDNGWCWLVTGRRILAWPREVLTPSGASPSLAAPPAARELTLPQTDLAHKADLVVVFYQDDAQMPSCIGVSPEGVVRYWESIGVEQAFVDVSCELGGQECERLCPGLLLATTTPTLVLLKPTTKDGRPTVVWQTLRPPTGWLGGIGRRVSSLFFGSMPAQAETKVVGVVVVRPGPVSAEGDGMVALVAGGAGGPVLTLWAGADLHHHQLRRALARAAAHHHHKHLYPHGDLSSVEIVCVDVRADGGGAAGLTLLLCAVSLASAADTRYAQAHISVEDPANPVVTYLTGIRTWASAEIQPRFLPLRGYTLLYTRQCIGVVSTNPGVDKADFIEVSGEGDQILGAELCHTLPLLFSRKHGVLALTLQDNLAPTSVCASPLGAVCADAFDGNLSLYEIDPHEVSMVTSDACGKLKTAFLFHLRRDAASCRAIIDELFPSPTDANDANDDVDAVLDRTVIKIASDMLDDIPNGDPRWKQRSSGPLTNIALGSSSALQIEAQLRDKQRAFTLFVEFLRCTGLWPRLKLLTRESGGGVVPTTTALLSLWEQLCAAVALRRLQQGPYRQLIDAHIYQVVCGENSDIEEDPEVEAALSSGALSPSDVCYRRPRAAWRVLRALCAAHGLSPQDTLATLHVLINVLQEMNKALAAWGGGTEGGSGALVAPPRPLLPVLAQLHQRALTQVARNCQDQTLRASIYEASAQLCDLVLSHTQHLPSHSPHHRTRADLIAALLEEGQTERAAVLAEKSQQWDLLVDVCMRPQLDLPRLYSYIDQHPNAGIADIAFARLAESGQWRALITEAGGKLGAALSRWLGAAPPRRPARALLGLQLRRPQPAAAALLHLADEETASVNRLATTASLAKLCLLASDEEPDSAIYRCVEKHLSLAEQHSALPRDIRVRYGLDEPHTPVMSPLELVQMYIECESKSLTEYDYKKALDLTEFISDIERRDQLRLQVWCACIKRDSWDYPVDAPTSELTDNTFFRLVDLVHVMGGDLEVLLPPVDDLLNAPELSTEAAKPRFQYLLKYGYQCLAAH